MSLIYLFVSLIVVMLLVGLTFKKRMQRFSGHVALLGPVIAAVYFIMQIPDAQRGTYAHVKIPWLAEYDINLDFQLTGLGLLFALLISVIGVAVFFYATQYLSVNYDNLPRFYMYLLLFMLSMLGVVLSNNTILLYIFWELTSISSFLLIAYWYDKTESQFGAMQSFMITVFGGMAMLIGFIMMYIVTGTNTISELIAQRSDIADSALFIPITIMMMIGAFTKSAQFPFHVWLPKAMAAPTPVSAYLHSATMVKAGIFLLFAFAPILGQSRFYLYTVTIVGIFTMLFGSVTAIRQKDLKALLAYSTISQLGMIMTLVGIGSGYVQSSNDAEQLVYGYVLFAALFHLVNHAIFKGALFMGVGIVDHETGTRDMQRLSGLRKVLPVTTVLMTVSAMSMAGLPLLNGFLSKEMFLESLLRVENVAAFNLSATVVLTTIGVIASIFTFVYALFMIKSVFFGKWRSAQLPKVPAHEPKGFTLSGVVLALAVIVIFFVPNIIGNYMIKPALQHVTQTDDISRIAPHISQWHGVNLALICTLIIFIVGLIGVLKVDWKKVNTRFKPQYSMSHMYTTTYHGLERSASYGLRALMSNKLNYYIIITLSVLILIVSYGFIRSGIPKLHEINVATFGPFEVIVLLIVVVVGIALVFIRQRLTMVIATGVIGYCVTIFFILMKAPDLALTQLVVETMTTILFIVSFSRLPNVPRGEANKKREVVKILTSLFTAVVVVGVVFVIQQGITFDTISTYYHNALDLTGGKNIVNAILGDFRSMDTMLEGIVLIIAGLGIFTLLNFKDRRGQDERE